MARRPQRQHDGAGNQRGRDQQGIANRDLHQVDEQHLAADEHQHQGQAIGQQVKAVGQVGQQEVQRAQAQDGEDVGREHDERVAGDGKDGGDAVHRKDDVGGADQHQHHEQRGVVLDAVDHGAELFAVKPVGDAHALFQQGEHRIGGNVGLLPCGKPHFRAGKHQKCAKYIQKPVEGGQQPGAHQNQQRAQHDGADDADDERALLVLRRHGKVAEQHQKHEDVVDRQAFFHQIAGDELH